MRFKDSNKLIHRWVAYTKIYKLNKHDYKKPFREYQIHHKDGNKRNNDVSNLELLDAYDHKTKHTPFPLNILRRWTKK